MIQLYGRVYALVDLILPSYIICVFLYSTITDCYKKCQKSVTVRENLQKIAKCTSPGVSTVDVSRICVLSKYSKFVPHR